MKKLLSVVLALSMILSMSVTAFAADNTSQEVTGEYTPTHKITFAEAEKGSVSASPTTEKDGVQYAKEGEIITLTPNPDEGYVLDTLTVTSENSEVEVSNNSFTMPTSDVTVKATFKEKETTPPAPTKYTVTVSETTNGSVTANPTSAAQGETVTLTVSADGGYELENLTVRQDEETINVTNNGDGTYTFTMPAGNVTVTATFKEQSKVGISIQWGKMSFSYDDLNEKWDAENDGNWVTVSTTDSNQADAISVSAEFTPADLMTEKSDSTNPIMASWKDDKKSATLNSTTTSCTFTLNLSGKPKEKFNGTIGTVTLTIAECTGTVLSTYDELKNAAEHGGDLTLGEDISFSGNDTIVFGSDTVLDLNGKKLTKTGGEYQVLSIQADVTIRDSSVSKTGAVNSNIGSQVILLQTNTSVKLQIENGTFYSSEKLIGQYYGTIDIKGGTFTGLIRIANSGSAMNIYGGTFNGNLNKTGNSALAIYGGTFNGTFTTDNKGTVTICGGTFGFDPTQYVDTDNYTVTNNEANGTWTVTATIAE